MAIQVKMNAFPIGLSRVLMVPDINDHGYKSRKFWLAFYGLLILFVAAIMAEHRPVMAALYSTLVGGVIGVVSAYFGGNVAQKWVATKQTAQPQEQDPEQDQ